MPKNYQEETVYIPRGQVGPLGEPPEEKGKKKKKGGGAGADPRRGRNFPEYFKRGKKKKTPLCEPTYPYIRSQRGRDSELGKGRKKKGKGGGEGEGRGKTTSRWRHGDLFSNSIGNSTLSIPATFLSPTNRFATGC